MGKEVSRQDLQAEQYGFPYHWLPWVHDSAWAVDRVLTWGYDYLALLEVMRDSVLTSSPQRVLDLGCGDGRLAHTLLRAGVPEVIGIDVTEQAVLFARAFNHHFRDRSHFHTARVQDLDLQGFDVTVAMEVLEHIPEKDIPNTVLGIWERTQPGGKLIVSVPTLRLALQPKHERHYTEGLLRKHLSPHFSIQSTMYVRRASRTATWLRRIAFNRVYALRHPMLLRYLTHIYRRRILMADSSSGTHLVAVSTRVASS